MLNAVDSLIRWALAHSEGELIGLWFAFIVVAVLTVASIPWLLLTTNRWWHQRFHVERGILRPFGFCGHCVNVYIRGKH